MENKFKRFLSMLLAIVMVVGMMPLSVFATENSSDCDHSAGYTNGKCNDCEAECAHQWNGGEYCGICNMYCTANHNTHDTDGYCTVCGYLINHSFYIGGDYDTTVANCTVCGAANEDYVGNYAAMIGDQGYASLSEAITAANAMEAAVILVYEDIETLPTKMTAPMTIKGAVDGIDVNCAIAEYWNGINGTVAFENLTFNNRISTEYGQTDSNSNMVLKFVDCKFNVSGTDGYAIQAGASWNNNNLGSLIIDSCEFNYVDTAFKGGYMIYAQCVKSVTITNNVIDGNNLYRGAIHLGDSTDYATVATVENNTIKNFCRGVMMGNRVEGSKITIDGNTFENINYNSADTKAAAECAPIFIHSNASAETTDVVITDNVVVGCENPMIYSEDEDPVADYVSTFSGNTEKETADADAAAIAFADSYNAPNVPAPVAEVNGTQYETLAAAVADAQAGDTVTVIADISDEAVTVDKNLTITGTATLNNVSITGSGTDVELTVSNLTFTGNSWINSGNAKKLTVSGVTATDVAPVNGSGAAVNATNSRSGFIALGSSEHNALELVIENCKIVVNNGGDPVIGWAPITKATISGNTFGSEESYQTNSDSVKFMSIAEGAVITVTGNTAYSNYNGFVFAQNTTRDNAYTVNVENNAFYGSADHIWIEVSGATTCRATVNAASTNTVNGEAFTASDIKASSSITTWTSYAGVDVVTDENGKVIGGTLAFCAEDAIAEGYEQDEDGKVVAVAIKGLSGSGTETDPYLISNLDELLWFQAKVDEQATDGSTQFAGTYFKLTADIDLTGINWNPIGSMTGDHGSFKGVFDGGGHTISNLSVEQAGNGLGLFAYTTGNAVIKNLNLVNVTVKSTDDSNYVGGLVGNAFASTKIENVHVSGDIQISGRGYIGGIVGHGYVVMDNVSVKGNEGSQIYSTFWCAGGILGYGGEGTTNIQNAHVEGLTITSAAGGLGAIVGMAEDNDGTQPISGSNLSAKNVNIKTYVGAYGTSYEDYAMGYLYGGNPTSVLTGTLTVEDVVVETASGNPASVNDAVATADGNVYFTLAAAIEAVAEGGTVKLLRDVEESIAAIENVKLITNVAGGVTVTNTYSEDYVKFNNVTVATGVTLNIPNVLSSGSVNVIEGMLNVGSTYYHRYDAKTTIQNGGKVITGGMTVMRYNNNADSGIYIYGDSNAETVEFSCGNTIGAYSGTFYAEDAVVEANMLWLDYKKDSNEEPDGYPAINAKFVNSVLKVTSDLRLYKDATMTLAGADVTAGKVQVRQDATPVVTMDSTSTIKATTVENLSGASLNAVLGTDGTVTFTPVVTTIDLTQGSYTITKAGEYVVSAYTGANTLIIQADATVTLEGVNITAAEGVSAISIESGDVTLNVTVDSTVTGGKGGAGVYVAKDASVTVKGGTLTAIGNGGTDTSDSGAAGIGGTYANGNSGAITIDGATVVAKGYGVHGSGIGSGYNGVPGAIEIINGANVTAVGGYYADGAGTKLQSSYGKSDPEGGAAIGGGSQTGATIGDITITDSTVVAYGGSKAAGIGAGFWASTGTITISGNSNVTAQGGSSSAGIGTSRAGDNGVSSNIVISGGTVKATGGDYGSGIGGGYNADSVTTLPETDITISGGTVNATGGMGGAAIGGGYKTDNVDIDITGGNITATAGALVGGKTVENGGAPAAIGTGANGSGTFETSEAVEIAETATVAVTAYEDGKPAVEGMTNEAVEAMTNVKLTETANPSKIHVATKAELDAAIANATAGMTIILDADIDYTGTATLVIDKAITLDLGGHTLTTYGTFGGMQLKNNCTLKNGTLNHKGTVTAIKAWTVASIEDLTIVVDFKAEGKTIGGIVIQENATGIGSIKNVTIKGEGLTNGIETYNCGNATKPVIGSMENVTIDAVGTGMLISAPCGTATNCSISGGTNGIEIWIKGTYSATLDLVGCDVTGGVYAHDEFTSDASAVNSGTLSLTVDEDTNIDADDVTLTIARAENVKGLLEEVQTSAVAKVGDTYYQSLAEAVAAANEGDTVTLIWAEGDDPIAMNGAVYGKTVTITGTATVDWSKGFLFVGRGGEGDGKVIFDNANLTSASDSSSYGIHVSGREKDTTNKYDGTLVIQNSAIELDYLINKGTMTLDNSTLTVKNGFSVGGRPASETETGEDATATLSLTNDSKLVVKNHNGMGLGFEAIGVMNIDATSSFETTQSFLVTEKGTMNINGGTVNVTGTLTNNGTIMVSGASNIAATVTGDGWVYMNGVTLDADTKLYGAKVRFASGTNSIDGSVIDDGFFQVGIGAYNGVDANVDTVNSVIVNVKNAVIGSSGSTYAGWIGSGYYDTDTEKAAAMTDAKYVLNIENSVAEFGYLHISNDGELNVKGNAAEKVWYNNSDYSFYAGDFIINGTATFDATDVLALYTKVSCDNGTDKPGTLNIVNGTEYEAERHNGAIAGTNFTLYKTGVVNADAKLHIGEYTSIAADAVLNIGGEVTALGTITNNGTINLTAVDATLTTPEAPTVNTTVADYEVTYADGAYKLVAKVYVASVTDAADNVTKFESLAEALSAAQDGDEVKILVAGTYSVPTGKNITITGAVDGVVFECGQNNIGMNGASVTFNHVTFNWAANGWPYHGLAHCGDMVYNDCIFNGTVFLYGTSETFNVCTFNVTGDTYNVWTYGAKEVAFNECTFNSDGKSVLIYSEQADLVNTVTVTESTFKASSAVEGKAAIEMDSSLTAGINLTIDGETTATGFGNGNVSGNSLWNNKKGSNTDANNDITVVVADETVLAPVTFVAKIGEIGYTSIADAITAAQAGETVTILAGEYTTDVSVNKAITVVGETDADGNNLVSIIGGIDITADGAAVKNLTASDPATSGNNCTLYISAKDVLVEGCVITDKNAVRYSYTSGTVTFKDSTITGSTYGIHFDGNAGGEIVIDNCVITGWTSFASTIEKVTITDTTFDEGSYNKLRFYQDSELTNVTFNEKMSVDFGKEDVSADFTNCTVENGGSLADVIYLDDLVNMGIDVTVNGEPVVALVNTEEMYTSLAEAVEAAENGDTVILLADVTENVSIEKRAGVKSITIDGNGNAINGKITVNMAVTLKGELNVSALVVSDKTLTVAEDAKVTVSGTLSNWSELVVASGAALTASSIYSDEEATIDINGGAVNVTGTLTNNGTIKVSGASDIAATVTGDGWVYMNGVTLDADTKLICAKVRFASGTNNIDGSVIDDGFFQVGIGAYNGVDANVDTTNGVIVNVKNAKIGSSGSTYAGWIGSGYYDTDAEKATAMTDAKYVLNIENSVAEFGYLHISNDGELNVTGNAAEKVWYNNSEYSFYAGDFIINGTATFDATDVLALYTKVSCDNGTDKPGTLNIVNGTEYEAERHNGAIAGTNFILYKTGVVNADAKLHIGEYTTIAADAVLNIGGEVTALGTITNNGTINLTAVNATLTTPEAPEVTTTVADYKVSYAEGAYTLVAKVYVAQVGETKFESLAEAVAAANEGDTVTLLSDITLTETLTIEKKITLDLNSKTLTGADDAIVLNVKAETTIKNGTILGNKSGTSSGLIDIYANLTMDGVTIETSKINALRFKVGECTATLTNCNVTGAFKGYGGSVWVIKSGTYKASSTSISDQLNGTASISGGTFHYEIVETECAPGYAVVDNGDDTWTVEYAPVCFVDANNNGTLDDGELVYGSLNAVFETYQEGDVYVVLTDDTQIANQVDTDADAHYYLSTNVAEGVTVDFLYADNWNYVQKMTIGENVTLNAPYFLGWTDIDIYGTVNTNYAYFMGADVVVHEGGVLDVSGGDATVQVKGGTKLTVNGTLNTSTLNVWVGASELVVSGDNAKVNASWIDIWDGTPSVTVENGATLDVDSIKASRGGEITVDGATLDATSIELGHNGESEGKLTETGESTINGEIKLTAAASTVTSDGGLNVTTNIADHKVVFEDGVYKVVAKVYVAEVNGTKYESLAEAITAVGNGETITLLADCDENVTIKQTAGLSFTIDGAGKNYTGTITVNGNSRSTGAETLTIQNVNFVLAGQWQSGIITAKSTFAHNITVDGCTFTGTDYQQYGIYLRHAYNITVKNTTGTRLFDLVYGNTAVTGFTAENVTVTDSSNGIWLSYVNSTATFKNVDLDVTNTGIGLYNNAGGSITVEESTIEAAAPVYVGQKSETNAVALTVTGENTLTSTVEGGSAIVLDGAKAKFTVTVPENSDITVSNAVAKIGNTYYNTFAHAYADAVEGDTVTLLAPIVVNAGETLTLDKAVTITYTSNVAGEDMITNKGKLVIDGANLVYTNTDTTATNVTVSTISCEPGSTLEVKSGMVKNDSANNAASGIYAYAIDLVTNGSLGDVTATISGGEVISTNYMAIRQFVNGEVCKNTLNVSGGTITGGTRGINIQLKNNMAYTTITGGKVVGGDYSLCFLTSSENLSVSGGEFIGSVWYSGTDGFISGGSFDEKMDEAYCAEGYIPVDNGNGTWTVKTPVDAGYVAQNTDGTYFATVSEALAAAKSGDTVKLITDCTEGYVLVTPGVTLDLNGYTLTASYVVAFGASDVIDSVRTGLLKVAQNNIVLDEGNAYVPVWNTVDGYTFTQLKITDTAQSMGLTMDGDVATFQFVTFFRDTNLLTDGVTDNDLSVVIRVSWTAENGTAYQNFVYNDEQVGTVVTENGGKAFKLTFSGCEGLEDLTFTAMVLSETGAVFSGNTQSPA